MQSSAQESFKCVEQFEWAYTARGRNRAGMLDSGVPWNILGPLRQSLITRIAN